MIVYDCQYGKRYTGLNVEGHQDGVIGKIFSRQKGPKVRKEKHVHVFDSNSMIFVTWTTSETDAPSNPNTRLAWTKRSC